ncbi:Uma2 family endonuclease [Dyadobacter psychrotolerans]|uniref:Uma2 family endonuclease n=1 Tax=Dyadobacter psychrotolerans TaxID=2541721 RepID=A0A4R5DLP5_9BACT|nr:Uma2 family endonuclease [Dyadobacter psychrotolerans]TDE12901.1 Uma2 family endonuclease [Dyadobacter psychrotolerans]
MQTTTLVTHEEYFQLLAKSDVKLEYNSGEIVAMAGAQPVHNAVTANLIAEFIYCLKLKNCVVLTGDQLIKVESCDRYSFPDLVIVCGKPNFEKSTQGIDALLNPEIVIEVLSDSTEKYDRLEKFDCYKTIPSFREYVLVSSKMKKVEVIKKLNEAEWLSHTYTEKDEFVLIGECTVLMADIYNKVDLL